MPWAAFGLFRYAAAAVYVLYSPVFVSSCDFLTLYVICTHSILPYIFVSLCAIFPFFKDFYKFTFSHFIVIHLRKTTDCSK